MQMKIAALSVVVKCRLQNVENAFNVGRLRKRSMPSATRVIDSTVQFETRQVTQARE
jgi:hypothetical protein